VSTVYTLISMTRRHPSVHSKSLIIPTFYLVSS
jgi:hypothetical protein